MIKKYKCIEYFQLEKYDENGYPTDEAIDVNPGEEFEYNDESYNIIDIEFCRLTNDNKWIEIDEETLDKCFKEI